VSWAPPKDTGGVKIMQYTLRMAPAPAEHVGAADAAGFCEVYTGAAPSVRIGKLPHTAPHALSGLMGSSGAAGFDRYWRSLGRH
jgi:hypothetical protein